MVRTVIVTGLFALLACSALAVDATPTAIDTLIQQLGSDDFGERELAEASLSKLGREADPALMAALKSDDAETRERSANAVNALHWRVGSEEAELWLGKFGAILGTERPGAAVPSFPVCKLGGEDRPQTSEETAALEWLSRVQEADGHWDSKKFGAQSNGDIAQTALAVLAFLGQGQSEKSGPNKDNIKRALEWLRTQQRADGAFVAAQRPVDAFTHTLAGMVMAEGAGSGRIRETIESAELAVKFTVAALQSNVDGTLTGFSRNADAAKADLLSTLFALLQLSSAKSCGMKVPQTSFDGASQFIRTCVAPDGIGYAFEPGQWPSAKATLAGCLCLQMLGSPRNELEKSVRRAVQNYTPTAGKSDSDPVFNYIGTLAAFHLGNVDAWAENAPLWTTWSDTLRSTVGKSMCKDGDAAGSWNPSGVWGSGGRVLTTALNAVCFEIHFRYRAANPANLVDE